MHSLREFLLSIFWGEPSFPLNSRVVFWWPEILDRVKMGVVPPFRPEVSADECPQELLRLMKHCWAENPNDRPLIAEVKARIKKITKYVQVVLCLYIRLQIMYWTVKRMYFFESTSAHDIKARFKLQEVSRSFHVRATLTAFACTNSSWFIGTSAGECHRKTSLTTSSNEWSSMQTISNP